MAKVQFKRVESNADVSNIPVLDGQLIYTKDGKQYMDYEQERVDMTSSGGGGGGGTVDTAMSSTSTNAVQNRVIKQYVDNKVASKTILWQNPLYGNDDWTDFPSGYMIERTTINLADDLMNYDAWEIKYYEDYNAIHRNNYVKTTGPMPIIYKKAPDLRDSITIGTTLEYDVLWYDVTVENSNRIIRVRKEMKPPLESNLMNSTKLIVEKANIYEFAYKYANANDFGGGTYTSGTDLVLNKCLQPLQIIGYKYS